MQSLLNHLADKKHVIWDWNGTLLGDLDHAVDVLNQILREEGRPEVTLDEYRKVFGFPIIDYYSRLGLDTSPQKFLDLCDRFNRYFYSGLHRCELWPGVRETLTEVKAAGKIQSVLSASEQKALEDSLKLFKLTGLFDNTYGIFNSTGDSKVGRGHELVNFVGVPKEQTVLIGDTDHDLEVGEALGIDVILVDHGHQCPLRLREVHHTVVNVGLTRV